LSGKDGGKNIPLLASLQTEGDDEEGLSLFFRSDRRGRRKVLWISSPSSLGEREEGGEEEQSTRSCCVERKRGRGRAALIPILSISRRKKRKGGRAISAEGAELFFWPN